MIRRFVYVVLVCIALVTPVMAQDAFDTYYEESGYIETPRYDETVDYCRRLADASPWLHYTTFGKSPQGRDLPLLVADRDGAFSPGEGRSSGKRVVLIQAGIHAGEIDGKDAGLMLLRDVALRDMHEGLLDHVTVLFVPILNVDGHERFGPYNRINQNGPAEMGYRVTAQRLNLNRDYLKVDAPETQSWLRLFNAWDPDFFVDCHVTDGTDHQYVMTYIVDIFGNMDPALTRWTRDVYLASVTRSMREAGHEMVPYVMLVEWPNPLGGIRSWVSTPRFSTGYTSLRNRPGLLVETHALKDYRSRVTGTYELLRHTLALVGRERDSLADAIRDAEANTASAAFRSEPYPLRFEPRPEGTTMKLDGWKFTAERSDVSGGTWYRFTREPTTFETPYLDRQRATATCALPAAYLVPPEWTPVIERLEWHGVRLGRLARDAELVVDSYRFENVEWQAAPFEGRHMASFDAIPIRESRVFPAGTAVIVTGQEAARVVAHVLEPEAPDAFVRWGFFNTVFEQKEYASPRVMERKAREMMAADERLAREFDAKRKADPEFAADPQAILNWFYQKTPYWDDRIGVYPVGKVGAEVLAELELED